ncbi:DWNN-domain-containing protein, partial [Rozella allomycis CSF55]
STIHYKFKSAKGFDKITFDGTGITIYDLKKEIIQQKKLVKSGYMDFDLIISDAQSKEEYSDDSQVVAKNSLVIVRRVPLNAVKKQKIQPQRKAKVITKEPPPNYICYRCGQKGHFIHQCPTNSDKSFDLLKVKRTTGIPKSFLKTVDASEIDKANGTVMVTDDGSLVVVQANTSEWEKLNQLKQGSTMSDITSMLSQLAIPAGLTCPLCSSLIRDAVSINCCGTDYCDECIR